MIRAIAGVYDRAWSGGGDSRRDRLARALERDGAAQTMEDGPFAVAWTGASDPAVLESPAAFCLLDGQLYNLEALAEQSGLRPGQTAEQVLLGAYARWGEGLLEQLRGDFVVLIWDRRSGCLLVARDQVNARPLYVHIDGDRVLFASEVRNLLRLMPRRPSPDMASVGHWLHHSRIPPDRTLYEGIARVPAGHVLRIVDGRPEQRRYWKPSLGARLEGSRQELAELMRAQIVRAVERRCEPGTTAVMLSGGLDSTTLAAVGSRCVDAERAPVGTYSMTFPGDPSSDETPQIDITTAQLGLANTRVAITASDILTGSLDYLDTWELPPTAFTLSSWLPLARRVAQDGVRVVLDGENGDDLFGFAAWLAADVARHGRPLAGIDLLRQTPELSSASTRRVLREARLVILKGNLPGRVLRAVYRVRGPARYFPASLNEQTARAYYESFDPWAWRLAGEPLWWSNRLAALLTGAFPAALYDHARRRAAMAGLDRRHPFSDLDLISFVHRLPPELAFDPHFNRPLLRESMAGLVPDAIRLQARKMDLNTFFSDAMAADLSTARSLLAGRSELRAYVRPEALQEVLVDRPLRGEEGRELANLTWRFMEMECWLRSQQTPSFARDLLAGEAVVAPTYTFIKRPAPPGEEVGQGSLAGT